MASAGITLVIPARNAAGTLAPCLDAVVPLLGRNGFDEILLVNDGSSDATVAIAQKYPVKVLTGPGRGPAGARNLGWRFAKNPLVWCIDADTVPHPDALAKLLRHFDDPAVAAAGGTYANQRPDSLLACLIHEEIVARHRAMPVDVNYLATFNVVYRKEVLEQLGGFDENFLTAEDVELSFRLLDAGYKLRFDIDSVVGHHHPTRFFPYLRSQRTHGYYRMLLYLQHRSRIHGDAYSGWVDHLQPPCAMLVLATAPLVLLGWPALVPGMLALMLFLLTLPMTGRLVHQTRQGRYAWYAPLSFVRAFARGWGMTRGVLQFWLLRWRTASRPPAAPVAKPHNEAHSRL